MSKKNMMSTVDEEILLLVEEYKRTIDPTFNRSEFIENCFKDLISGQNEEFKQKEELIKEKQDLILQREELTRQIATISAKIAKFDRVEKRESEEQTQLKEQMYESLKVNKELDF